MFIHGTTKVCPCGSGLPCWNEHDARGIFLARVCTECEEERLSAFRPDVFTDSSYECDEPIEED